MTIYIVHLYREMRLSYTDIEAETPHAAAEIARDKLTSDADDIDDCEGESLSALVDVAGDEAYCQSVLIDFEGERQTKAASALLVALLLAQRALNAAPRFRVGDTDSYSIAALIDRAILGAANTTPDGSAGDQRHRPDEAKEA